MSLMVTENILLDNNKEIVLEDQNTAMCELAWS